MEYQETGISLLSHDIVPFYCFPVFSLLNGDMDVAAKRK